MIRQFSTVSLLVLSCAGAAAAQAGVDPDPAARAGTLAAAAAATVSEDAARSKAKTDGKPADAPSAEPAKGEANGPATATSEGKGAAPAAAPGAAPDAAATGQEERDDAVLDRAQPDFTLINLPTNLRMPQWKSSFRVTHRFTRPLGQGDLSSLVEDLFGLDSGAVIGLDFRMGILPGTQVGVYRTNDRTIQLSAQYDLKQQSDSFPISIAAYGSVDGTNNFRDSYTPAVGVILSRKVSDRLAVYAEPFWVNNTNPLPEELVDDNDTILLGIGARVRIRPTVYVVGEFVPRVAGYDPGSHATAFAIEKRSGGHAFQLTFSNSFGLTMSQIARGGPSAERDDWFLGFNISRKFF